MSSRAKRLEFAVSICLLAILFLIGLGVFLRQFHSDIGRFGIELAAAPKSEIPADLGTLTPAGFEALSGTEVYNSENLYEKINGKAALYLDSGFKKLLTQRFANKKDGNLWMELFVYDMDNIANAFSVYSTQKRAEAEMLSFAYPRFHYKTSNSLYFVHGKYYVEAVGSSQSTKLLTAMVELAQKISSALMVDDDTRAFEAKMASFPKENIVQGSIRLYLTGTFGFEGLTDTFTARYKIDDESITAFFSKRPDLKDAEKVAENYRNFLIDNGGEIRTAINKSFEGKIIAFRYPTQDEFEVVSSTGPFLVGVHEAKNQQAAEELAERLISKLNEVINSE